MSLTWENSQNYSNDPSSYSPGFWFHRSWFPEGRPFDPDEQLSPFDNLTPNLTAYKLVVDGNTTVSPGNTALASLYFEETPSIIARVTLKYEGALFQGAVEPNIIAELQITGISFVDRTTGKPVTVSNVANQANTYYSPDLYQLQQSIANGTLANNYTFLQLAPADSAITDSERGTVRAGLPVAVGPSPGWQLRDPPIVVACFLPGAMITTEAGPKAVEDLAVGDLVLTGPIGDQKLEPVTWVGKGHVYVLPHLPCDEAGYSICIRKDALGEGCPNADLYVTSEHTLYFEGRLVPARMLVNHRSIYYDREQLSYEYYHFETASHSIVHANNVATESYLDTGNRRHFRAAQPQQDGNVLAFPTPKEWAKDAYAPLTVTADFVQPLYQRLEERAKSLGFASQQPSATLTYDSNIHLITDKGETLHPLRRVKDRVVFHLPEGVKTLRLRSRTSRPCDTLGPYIDDRRNLGVLVGEIELHQGGQVHTITHHLTDQHTGWDVKEEAPCRWTNGDALLPLQGIDLAREHTILTIQLLTEGPYHESPAHGENILQQAAS